MIRPFRSLIQLYAQAYGGLPRAAWLLAFINLVNRCGAMVLPFMALYLTQSLHYTIAQAGNIMSIFGLGSIAGAYLGGRLADSIGQYKVQLWSLLLSSMLYFVLMRLQAFEQVAACVFVLSLVAEAFRPANTAAVAYYNSPDDLARAYALNRLASNLGYSIGPALGGLLAAYNFSLIFVADGLTSLMAAALFVFIFGKKAKQTHAETQAQAAAAEGQVLRSPYRDANYLVFIGLALVYAVCFFQLFSTLPLYYKQAYQLSERSIGLLLALNGLLVATVEMVLIYKIGERVDRLRMIGAGTLLVGVSYVVLNVGTFAALPVLGIVLITFGEILSMPFMNVYAVERATPQTRGQYLALHVMVYSAAHVLAPAIGTRVASAYGFQVLWYAVGAAALIAFAGFAALRRWRLAVPSASA